MINYIVQSICRYSELTVKLTMYGLRNCIESVKISFTGLCYCVSLLVCMFAWGRSIRLCNNHFSQTCILLSDWGLDFLQKLIVGSTSMDKVLKILWLIMFEFK